MWMGRQAPPSTDASHAKLEIENSVIMVWLIHLIIREIGESYLDMAIACDIWDSVAGTYSRKGNYAKEFELQQSIDRSKQSYIKVLQYAMFLTNG